ncbi:hypothetical protein HG536_0F04240 [Torulaspora globosa]|uniref:DNA repair protein REV1 n=1 Tax=Torulaspora globosa TaxID=48254 RepID=A0A7G3ZKR2_9SACH|nr:uncharacterized protein HG536_0F04240 [Torulaspora globosa]QLL34098.1 hypothetical protein HG536_0F04240 [Torulaspora globosa]
MDDDKLLAILESSQEGEERGLGPEERDPAETLGRLSDDALIEYMTNLSQGARKDFTREEYFRDKEIKQRERDEATRAGLGRANAPIFAGCTIYINGYTKPGRLQLHEMIVSYGGKFQHYLLAKKKVTHIVATNLPLKKRLEFRNYRVVRPEWITESIEQQKLLPWQDYALSWDQEQRSLQLKVASAPVSSAVDCKDPNFLKTFFENSRLHHLSNWKADLRSRFLSEGFNKPSPGDALSIFHIDFDCFFATVAALGCESCDINRDPIVVCHGSKSSDIASCNYVARKYGIRNGMWVSRAKSLLPPGVELVSLPYNFKEIEEKSKIFYTVLKEYKIKFDLILPISIDEAVCVVIDHHTPHPIDRDEICRELRSEIWKRTGGCTVSIGCSNTLVLARLNLKIAKPNGYHILTQQQLVENEADWHSYLGKFQIDDLPGIGYSIVSKLRSLRQHLNNLLQLKQYFHNSLPLLQKCVGKKTGSKILMYLHGKDDEESSRMIFEPESFFARKSLSIEINWGIRFDTVQEIDNFIDTCADYLVQKLQEMNKRTSQITLKVLRRCADAPIEPPKYLGCGECDALSHNCRLGIPTSELGVIATELKSTFRLLGCPPKDLRGVSIQFNKLIEVSYDQNENQQRLKLPFQKTLNFDVFDNLPSDVKNDFSKELKRRNIVLTSSPRPKTSYAATYEEKFMEELPTQIRNEVKNDLRINRKITRTKLSELREQNRKKKESIRNVRAHLLGHESLFEPIKFQKESRFKDICRIVMEWFDATLIEGPHEKDLLLFENYLDKLSDSNRVPLILRFSKLISVRLNLKSNQYGQEAGFQEWEQFLLKNVIPKLNKNKHTFQTVRKLDIDFDI